MAISDIFKIKKFKQRIEVLEKEHEELGFREYREAEAAIKKMQKEADETLIQKKQEIQTASAALAELKDKVEQLSLECEKTSKQCKTNINKINKCKELYRAIEHSLEYFHQSNAFEYLVQFKQIIKDYTLDENQKAMLDDVAPTVTLNLHCMDIRDLRKAYRENEKKINELVEAYKGRYTTKANQTIYELMVIALRAELQNILYVLKYEKLDDGIDSLKKVTTKYLEIATNGSKSIATTITRFIGELEYLFINAIKIEYNYYVKKEQARQEQLAIREKMRQEAEERKALEQEKKKIEAEEQKYLKEIERLKEQLAIASEEEANAIQAELSKVEGSLADVVVKKDDIVNLQNGKAGNVYIISNLGSFGENVFKIGMTRRLDPQDRVDELGSASVPFHFDVHSFIFSEDAVSLESELHKRLNEKRVNKVNMRKEFFYSTIDELEALTMEISPSAEFVKTMAAQEFRQSLSSDNNYSTDYRESDDEEYEE